MSLVAVLKNGKELFLMRNVPSEVMFSLIENHPSAPGNFSRSESRSDSDSMNEESASQGVYESDDEEAIKEPALVDGNGGQEENEKQNEQTET